MDAYSDFLKLLDIAIQRAGNAAKLADSIGVNANLLTRWKNRNRAPNLISIQPVLDYLAAGWNDHLQRTGKEMGVFALPEAQAIGESPNSGNNECRQRIAELEEEVKELKRKLNINSGNSGISPSQDPFRPKGKGGKKKDEDNSDKSEPNQGGDSPDKPGAEDQGENSKPDSEEQSKRKQGGQKGHKGNRQELRKTQDVREIFPERCSCGCEEFVDLRSFYTHQHFELPDILLHVTHFNLYVSVQG